MCSFLKARDQVSRQNTKSELLIGMLRKIYGHVSRHKNTSFERAEQFKHFRITLTNHDSIHEEIKSRFKPRNAYCHSVQNTLSSSLLSKNVKIKIHKTVMSVALYRCEVWPLSLREEDWLRKIFGLRKDEVTGE